MTRMMKIVAVAVLALSSSGLMLAQGSNPFVGTWKINKAKTKEFGTYPMPRASEMTVVMNEGNYEVAATGTGPDGKPISFKYSFAAKGGAVTFGEGSLPGYSSTATVPSANVIDSQGMIDGKAVQTIHTVIKGKTSLWTIIGTDAQGKPYELVEEFDRQ